jgi:hypothetical protein
LRTLSFGARSLREWRAGRTSDQSAEWHHRHRKVS